MEEEKKEPVSRLLENAENIKTLTIKAKDGNEYILSPTIPSALFRFVNSNSQLLRRLLPINEEGIDYETQQRGERVLNQIITLANKVKYPQLTVKYIEENFEPEDFTAICIMYIGEWARIVTETTSTVTPPAE